MMRKCAGWLAAAVCCCVAFCSCDEYDPWQDSYRPVPLLSRVSGDGFDEYFDRASDGRIVRWTRRDGTVVYRCDIDYGPGNVAHVSSTVYNNGEVSEYEDVVHFGADGLAEWSEGRRTIYNDGYPEGVISYNIGFRYNYEGQLTGIHWRQWRDDAIYDGPYNPWEWTCSLVWRNGDLVRYEDNAGATSPRIVHEYSYTGIGNNAWFSVPFVIMPQYYPLQLSGCFGVLPRHLVAEERYSSFYGESYRILYNYGSSDGFAVDRFSRTFDYGDHSRRFDYRVFWTR